MTKGNRLPVVNHGTKPEPMIGELNVPMAPGDYCGPLLGYTGDKPAVFFLPPNAKRGDHHHHVVSPPHAFIEEPDGTLTIHASIQGDGFHGFLEHGVWREC